jgi:hypothetical protein
MEIMPLEESPKQFFLIPYRPYWRMFKVVRWDDDDAITHDSLHIRTTSLVIIRDVRL